MNTQDTNFLLTAPTQFPYETTINCVPVIVTPEGWTIHELNELLDKPRRVKHAIELSCLASFIEYVNRHKEPTTVIFVHNTAGESDIRAEAIIDYHERPKDGDANKANWGEHLAIFQTSPTSPWMAWFANNGKLMPQSDFTDFIYQNQPEIMEPSGSELLEIISTLKATSKGTFRNMKELHTGSIDLVMNVKVSAQGGSTDRPLSLPQQFRLSIQPFYGGPTILLTADLVIRVPKEDGDPVMFAYRFFRMKDVLDGMAQTVEQNLGEKTELPVYRCK